MKISVGIVKAKHEDLISNRTIIQFDLVSPYFRTSPSTFFDLTKTDYNRSNK